MPETQTTHPQRNVHIQHPPQQNYWEEGLKGLTDIIMNALNATFQRVLDAAVAAYRSFYELPGPAAFPKALNIFIVRMMGTSL